MHLQEGVLMLDNGCMPRLHPRSSDRNVHGEGCGVATREKTSVFSPMGEDYCLHYVLFLMHLSVALKQSLHCYNLILARFAR